MSDLELLKRYLQNEIDTGGNKIFVFDKDYNIIEFKTIGALNEINGLQAKLQQKENIIKEVRERAKRELKIAEENIKNSEKWLDIEEEQEHAKRDIHTGKVVKRDMEMFLEILDKESII